VDKQFETITAGHALPSDSARQLIESGFVIIPGPIPAQRIADLAAAYDKVMSSVSGPDFKVASTTTRMYDMVNRGPVFDEIYIHPPLLEACAHVIGEPFKLSSLLARTLRAKTPAQDLHVDLPRDSKDAPMIGFILMIDRFQQCNGATRFVPASQNWPDLPSNRLLSAESGRQGEVLACGQRGSMIIFNGAIWHGHTANSTTKPRRSIQGYFVRRSAESGLNFGERMLPETLNRISPLARYLLAV
jgi:hypothetical protein